MDKLLKSSDVAEFLDVSVRSVHRLCDEGKLAFVRISANEKRFTQSHLDEFIKRQTEEVREGSEKKTSRRLPSSGSAKKSHTDSFDALRKKMKAL